MPLNRVVSSSTGAWWHCFMSLYRKEVMNSAFNATTPGIDPDDAFMKELEELVGPLDNLVPKGGSTKPSWALKINNPGAEIEDIWGTPSMRTWGSSRK